MRRYATPRPRQNGAMNKLEATYAQHLAVLQSVGEVWQVAYEGVKLKLAPSTFYTPDFLVITPTAIELHETKGYWHEDARVKIKVAAALFPHFVFKAITKERGQWVVEDFNP